MSRAPILLATPFSSPDDPVKIGNVYRAIGDGARQVVGIDGDDVTFVCWVWRGGRWIREADRDGKDLGRWTCSTKDFLDLEESRTLARIEKA